MASRLLKPPVFPQPAPYNPPYAGPEPIKRPARPTGQSMVRWSLQDVAKRLHVGLEDVRAGIRLAGIRVTTNNDGEFISGGDINRMAAVLGIKRLPTVSGGVLPSRIQESRPPVCFDPYQREAPQPYDPLAEYHKGR